MFFAVFILISGGALNWGFSHFFYRNYARNDVSLSYRELQGIKSFSYGFFYLGKEDFFIKRKVDELGFQAAGSIEKKLDTLAIFTVANLRREVRNIPLWREQSLSLKLSKRGKYCSFFKVISEFELIGKKYVWGGERKDNSGAKALLLLHFPPSAQKVGFKIEGEERRLSRYGGVSTEFFGGWRNLQYTLNFSLKENRFPHPVLMEKQNELEGGGSILLNFNELGVEGNTNFSFNMRDIRLMRDFLHSRKLGDIKFESALETRRGRTKFKAEYALSLNIKDFKGVRGDEDHFFNSLKLFLETNGRLGLFRLSYGIALSRFIYPEKIILDDRDERRERVLFHYEKRFREHPVLKLELLVDRRNLVYIKSIRSASTRKVERYILKGSVEERGALFFLNRAEIAAFYTKYHFTPENNVLLRYLLESVNIAYPADSSFLLLNFKYRTQDQGSYIETVEKGWVYMRNLINDEIEISPSIRFFEVGKIRGFLNYRAYRRYRKFIGYKRELVVGESGVGIKIYGRGLRAEMNKIWRRGIGSFYLVNLSYESYLNF